MTVVVGGIELPIAAGSTGGELADPTVKGLLAYLAFCLGKDLDAKLAKMPPMSAAACPSGHAHPWDPNTHFVRNALPSLYLWWAGVSRPAPAMSTLVYDVQERVLQGLYVFDEHVAPDGLLSRVGLLAAVNASLANACKQRSRSDYTPSGGTAGQDVGAALGLVAWKFNGSKQGSMTASIPSTSPVPGGPPEGHIKRGLPALAFELSVWEQVGTFTGPFTTTADSTLTISGNDGIADSGDVLELMQRKLPGSSP